MKKRVPIYKKEKIVGWREMRIDDVRRYFRSITPKHLIAGEYCERCGILIGDSHECKKPTYYNNKFYLCNGCIKDKNEGFELTPDLEDLERFGVGLL